MTSETVDFSKEKQEISPKVPSFYVEGVSGMLLGYPCSRIMFYSMLPRTADGTPEGPPPVGIEIVMPTPALVETLQKLLNEISVNKEALKNASKEWSDKVVEVLEALPMPVASNAKQK